MKNKSLNWIVPSLPKECIIETGNICNLRCKYCPTGLGKPGMSKGMMSLNNFKIILSKIKSHVLCIEMVNWGEPFLNPEFIKMVRLASRIGIRVNADSNLCSKKFDMSYCKDIVRSGLWRLRASIDASTQETYEQYRINGNIHIALANLKKIALAKKKLKSNTPVLEWQFLVNGRNEHEINIAKTMAQQLGTDIVFRPMDTWGNVSEESFLHYQQARGEFNDEQWTFRNSRIYKKPAVYFSASQELYRLRLRYPMLNDHVPQACVQPFVRMVINWDGHVLPCCNCYGNQFFVGNIIEENFADIWYNEEMINCRKFLLNYGPIQSTGSVCEKFPCTLNAKYLSSPDSNNRTGSGSEKIEKVKDPGQVLGPEFQF